MLSQRRLVTLIALAMLLAACQGTLSAHSVATTTPVPVASAPIPMPTVTPLPSDRATVTGPILSSPPPEERPRTPSPESGVSPTGVLPTVSPPEPSPTPSPIPTPVTVTPVVRPILPTVTLPPVTPTPTELPTPTPTSTPTVPPTAPCDLAVAKQMTWRADNSGLLDVTITLRNLGGGPCPAGETLLDPEPMGLLFILPVQIEEIAGHVAWQCQGTTCVASDAIPGGYVAMFRFAATLSPHAPGQVPIVNCARVTDLGDANPQNNQVCVELSISLTPTPPPQPTATPPPKPSPTPTLPPPPNPCDFHLTKQVMLAPSSPGTVPGRMTVSLTLANSGPSTCIPPARARIIDRQPAGMTFFEPVQVDNPSWSCVLTNGVVECAGPAPLPAHSVTVTFPAVLNGPIQSGQGTRNCASAAPMGLQACATPTTGTPQQ